MSVCRQTRVVRANNKLLELVRGSIPAHSHAPEFKSRPRNHYHYQRLRDIPQPIQVNTGFVPQIGPVVRIGTLLEFTVHWSFRRTALCSMLASLSGTKQEDIREGLWGSGQLGLERKTPKSSQMKTVGSLETSGTVGPAFNITTQKNVIVNISTV